LTFWLSYDILNLLSRPLFLFLSMPNKQNAAKALRQSLKRRARNLVRISALKKTVKATTKAVAAGEKNTLELARAAQQALDKAAKSGVIKKRTAARRLSRLMKKVHAVKK
jgi:small subunit ribosomal protein S20